MTPALTLALTPALLSGILTKTFVTLSSGGRPVQSDTPARRRTRRRGSATDPLTKVTFQIHESVMERVRAAVDLGAAPSLNAFMERAADLLLRELRREEVYDAYGDAARDAAYRKEHADLQAEFETTLADGLSPRGDLAPPQPAGEKPRSGGARSRAPERRAARGNATESSRLKDR